MTAKVIYRFLRNRSGNISISFALALIPIVAAVGAAVDYSQANSSKTSMQSAADATALALVKMAASLSSDKLNANAHEIFLANFNRPGVSNIGIVSTYDSGSASLDIEATGSIRAMFMPVVGFKTLKISARSTARAKVAGAGNPACLIALEPNPIPNVNGVVGAGAGALNASGGGLLNLTNCNIYVNSPYSRSIDVTGGGTIAADYVYTVGNYSGNVTATKSPDKKPTTFAPATPDPYAARQIPVTGPCSGVNKWSGNISNPGILTICGDVKVDSATTLSPGIYIILDGSLNSSKPISGNGVTIILTSSTPPSNYAIFNFSAGATLTLSAPSSGPTAGMVLWADGRMPHNADQFKAGTTGNITGAIYLPSHVVNYSGSATAGSKCTQLVAKVIAISGGASFNHDCDGVGISDPGGSENTSAFLVR